MPNVLAPSHHYQPTPEDRTDLSGSETLETMGFGYEALPGDSISLAEQAKFEYPANVPASAEAHNYTHYAETIQQAARDVVILRTDALAEGKLPAADTHSFTLPA